VFGCAASWPLRRRVGDLPMADALED